MLDRKLLDFMPTDMRMISSVVMRLEMSGMTGNKQKHLTFIVVPQDREEKK